MFFTIKRTTRSWETVKFQDFYSFFINWPIDHTNDVLWHLTLEFDFAR